MQKGSFTLYYNLKLCFLLLFLFTRLCSVYLFFYFTADIIVVVEKNSQQHNSIVCTLTLCIHFSISLVFIFSFILKFTLVCLTINWHYNTMAIAMVQREYPPTMRCCCLSLLSLFVCLCICRKQKEIKRGIMNNFLKPLRVQ